MSNPISICAPDQPPESPSTTIRPWRILSLDGGGVRGLAELLILQRIFGTMEAILTEELGADAGPLLPCDFFDLIGGTSTGGMIALLLGRLRLPIHHAIAIFKSLSEKIFPWSRGNWIAKGVAVATSRAIYDKTVFETEIRDTLARLDRDPEERMIEEQDPACRVFVCATRLHTSSSILLRTYKTRNCSQANHSVRIWQAARATSAAPPFFDSINIEDCGLNLLDGAIRLNNPINETLSEAGDIDPDREYGCIVSIGTGVADVPSLEKSLWNYKVVRTCVKVSTDCEEVAAKFLKSRDGRKTSREGKYFRFNVPRRLHAVGLDGWEKHDAVQEYVETYLENMGKELDQCARKLLHLSGHQVAQPQAHRFVLPPITAIPSSNPLSPFTLPHPSPPSHPAIEEPRTSPVMPAIVERNESALSTNIERPAIPIPLLEQEISTDSGSSPLDQVDPTTSPPPSTHCLPSAHRTITPKSNPNTNLATVENDNTNLSIRTAHTYGPAPSVFSAETSFTFTNFPVPAEPKPRNPPSSTPPPTSSDPLTAALATGRLHLSHKQFNLAFEQFKLALSLLKTLTTPPRPVADAIAAHLGMHESLVQAASAKKRKSPDKAIKHLNSALISVQHALSLAKANRGDANNELYMRQAELALVVIAIMRAEVEAQIALSTGSGTGSGNPQRATGKIGEEHAGCLMERVESLRKALRGRVRGVSTGDDEEGDWQEDKWLALEQKADAWRGRLAVNHCNLAELGG